MPAFSVSQFVEFLNAAFAAAVFPVGADVEGEVSAYRVSQGKWIWFDLKDEQSSVSCFATVWQLRTPLEDGMRVRVHGLPKVYPKNGRFSLTVERVEPIGAGALARALELLKKKLAAEGLFAPERKRPLPRFPSRIGLIASAGSAAYGDFLRILGDRWSGLTIEHVDVAVQGRDAAAQIAAAFRYFNSRPGLVEAIVLTRGGGSLEDLQAFNTEEVARAVFGSAAPVVVGVGHERDESLADLAADVRASTPSNAAEIIVPDRREIAAFLAAASRRLCASMDSGLAAERARIDRLNAAAGSAFQSMLRQFASGLTAFRRVFDRFVAGLTASDAAVAGLGRQLCASAGHLTSRLRQDIAARERLLTGLDPRRLLGRGYALVRRRGRVVSDAAQVDVGEKLEVQLARGALVTEVKERILASE